MLLSIKSICNLYVEESNGNKYLTLVPTDESKDSMKNKIWRTMEQNPRTH